MLGLDFLGGALFPRLVLKLLPAGVALGIFAQEFGDAFHLVEAVAARGNTPLVRIQLIYHPNHRYGDSDLSMLRREARRYSELALKYPNVIFQLSPFCEHNLRKPDKYLFIVAREAPNCEIINSPSGQGAQSAHFKNEIHGGSPRDSDYQFSFDGTNALAVHVATFKERYAGADVMFLWHYSFNGFLSSFDRTLPSMRRGRPNRVLIKKLLKAYTPLANLG